MVHTTLKPFKAVKENLALIYFEPNPNASFVVLLQDHWKAFLKAIFGLISVFTYLFYGAETVNEFLYSAFFCTVAFFVFLAFTSTVRKTSALFEFLDGIEAIINKSG